MESGISSNISMKDTRYRKLNAEFMAFIVTDLDKGYAELIMEVFNGNAIP